MESAMITVSTHTGVSNVDLTYNTTNCCVFWGNVCNCFVPKFMPKCTSRLTTCLWYYEFCRSHSVVQLLVSATKPRQHWSQTHLSPLVEPDTAANAPSGCSHWQGKWYFNDHDTGASLTVKAIRFVDQIKQVVLNATLKNTLTIYHKNFVASICVQ